MAEITSEEEPQPRRAGTAPIPAWSNAARHNSYRVKRPGDNGTRHDGPATIRLANPVKTPGSSMINLG